MFSHPHHSTNGKREDVGWWFGPDKFNRNLRSQLPRLRNGFNRQPAAFPLKIRTYQYQIIFVTRRLQRGAAYGRDRCPRTLPGRARGGIHG